MVMIMTRNLFMLVIRYFLNAKIKIFYCITKEKELNYSSISDKLLAKL